MTYVYSGIKEIKTMRLDGFIVKSEIDRNIYAVRFIGEIKKIEKEDTKITITITDDNETIKAIAYPHISEQIRRALQIVKKGDKAVFYAHLEPKNKICYLDIIKKVNKKNEIEFLAGLFLAYFKEAFQKNEHT